MNPANRGATLLVRSLTVCATLFIFGCHGDGEPQADSSRMSAGRWAEHPASPIVMPGPQGSWNEIRADTGNSIIQHKGRWYLYHSGEDAQGVGRIGLHVSSGKRLVGMWQLLGDKPVLRPGGSGSWDSESVVHPSVIRHQGVFWMYYSGTDGHHWRVGLARSGNGIDWKKLPTPVFSPGPEGSWDTGGVMHPSVVYDGRRFVMAYAGWSEGSSEIQSRIGIAVSADGLKWSRFAAEPVLGYGGKGQWDELGLLAPRLWVENQRYFMNYSGKETETAMSSLGHASADSLGNWTKSAANPMLHHSLVRYHEIEWGTPVWFEHRWYLLATAYFDRGVTTLWQEALR